MKHRLMNVLPILLVLASFSSACYGVSLEYLYRYNRQQGSGVDHLLTALATGPNRAIVAGYPALALVDLSALPVGGATSYLSRITGVNARNLYLKGSYVFVNEHAMGNSGTYGFSVVRINGDTLQKVRTVSEPRVLYEKMCVFGNYLCVTAHNKGLRVYDITDPENPVLAGRIDAGFIDAFAVEVVGATAYVADGAGGLKIVDITDPTHPVLTGGENLSTSIGTAEAIAARNGKVYMTVGGAGIAVYSGSDLVSRQIVSTGGFAEDLCWVGDRLAVSTYPAIAIFDLDADGMPVLAAREITARRDANATLRICCGLGAADSDRVLVANWNYMDVYRIKPAGGGAQPDVNSTEQRIRFSPNPGTHVVTLANNGQGDMQITGVTSTSPAFSTGYSGGALSPGQSVSFGINYDGSASQGSGIIRIASSDPDENPLPVQVFGNTSTLDPGEQAMDFTLPAWSRDPQTGTWSSETFTLSQQRGKVVWFAIYGSW